MPELSVIHTRSQPGGPLRHGLVRSAAMQEVAREMAGAIRGTGGVLLTGEPGTGREWIGKAIHLASHDQNETSVESLLRRAMRPLPTDRPFVVVDCADRLALEERLFGLPRPVEPLSDTELERILYGSAVQAGMGGTLFLRHITEMPARIQGRLARLFRHGEVLVVDQTGQEAVAELAIRPIATVERLMEADVAPELLRRMSHAISVPPLRERREDIPGLVGCFLADLCEAADLAPKVASRQAAELLRALPWRGNVAELEALLNALVGHVPGRQIKLAHVLECVRLDGQAAITTYTGTLKEARECFERDYVKAVLDRHRGRMAEAARTLGLQRTNLYRKVRQLSVARRSAKRHLS